MVLGFGFKMHGGSVECRCSRNTLILLGLIISIFLGFIIVGLYSYKPKNDDCDSSNSNAINSNLYRELEKFQEVLDSNVEIVGQYRNVFNPNTIRILPQKTNDIHRITDSNHAKIDKDLEHLQAKIAILVEKMNTNLYRQLQRNYRVANYAAIQRSTTDLSGLPNRF